VQPLKRQNTPCVKNSLFLFSQGLTRFNGLAHAQNSGTIRATRPLGRGTPSPEAGPRIYDLRFMSYDLKAEGRRLCRTKPKGDSQQSAGRRFCKTKPIWWGQMCETNPIGEGCRAETPNLPRATRAKQSQTWEDWGMWARAVIVCGPTSPESKMCKTNPMWPATARARGAKCAKRTQFRRECRHRRDRTRQTNPIYPSEQAGRAVAGANCAKQTQLGGPNVRNEANLPAGGPAKPWLERIVRNEPNFGPASQPGTPDCVKQSQFSPVGPGRWI
jgi:hypothetical protein